MSPCLPTPTGFLTNSSNHPNTLEEVGVAEEKADSTPSPIKPDHNMQHLKDLLTESLEESLQLPKQNNDQDDGESSKACISPTGRIIVEGKEMNTHRSLDNLFAKSRLEVTILKE